MTCFGPCNVVRSNTGQFQVEDVRMRGEICHSLLLSGEELVMFHMDAALSAWVLEGG